MASLPHLVQPKQKVPSKCRKLTQLMMFQLESSNSHGSKMSFLSGIAPSFVSGDRFDSFQNSCHSQRDDYDSISIQEELDETPSFMRKSNVPRCPKSEQKVILREMQNDCFSTLKQDFNPSIHLRTDSDLDFNIRRDSLTKPSKCSSIAALNQPQKQATILNEAKKRLLSSQVVPMRGDASDFCSEENQLKTNLLEQQIEVIFQERISLMQIQMENLKLENENLRLSNLQLQTQKNKSPKFYPHKSRNLEMMNNSTISQIMFKASEDSTTNSQYSQDFSSQICKEEKFKYLPSCQDKDKSPSGGSPDIQRRHMRKQSYFGGEQQ